MCELLGMSARLPADLTLSLNEFARHGGETGDHVDGWGVAFYDGPDANLIRETTSAANSELMSTLRGYKVASQTILAHIRRASMGPVELKNTHPFRREMNGRVHTFAHNGDLTNVRKRYGLGRHRVALPIGDTDSEFAFCLLLQRLAEVWGYSGEIPSLSSRMSVISEFASDIGVLGPANFLYSDGDALFVHGHVRTQPDGTIRSPGLHYISVACNYGIGQSELVSLEFQSDHVQQVFLVSTMPLREGGWRPMAAGQVFAVRGGEILYDSHDLMHPLMVDPARISVNACVSCP